MDHDFAVVGNQATRGSRSAGNPYANSSRNTQRLNEYIEKIKFRKKLGRDQSEGALKYQEMTMSEIIEDMQNHGRQSKLYFLYKYQDQILKDIDAVHQDKHSRYSMALKSRNSDLMSAEGLNYDSLEIFHQPNSEQTEDQYSSVGST